MKKYILPHAGLLLCAMLFAVLAALAAVLVQFLKGSLLDHAINRQAGLTTSLALGLLLVILFEIGCYYLFNRCRGLYLVRAKEGLRAAFFQGWLDKPITLDARAAHGEALASYTDKLDTVANQMLANTPLLAEVVFKIALVTGALFLLDARIAVLTLLLSTTPLYVPRLIQKRLQGAQTAHMEAFAGHLGRVAQWLQGLELIRNFSAQRAIRQLFDKSNRQVREKHLDMLKAAYLSQTISTSLSYLSHFIILAFSAWLVAEGSFTAGQFFIAVGMIDQMSYPILSISIYLQEIIAARPALSALEREMAVHQPDDRELKALQAPVDLRFEQVGFAYPGGSPLFDGLSLQMAAGQKCLITGPSGGGKSTLMSLLLGYAQPLTGRVLLNGVEASQARNLMEMIAVMRQDAVLFEDSLRNNICLYREIPDEQIIMMLKRLKLEQFASPEGLDCPVSEGGKNLSGGQRRRISLARTLLRSAPVIIMDEPLAEVDPETALEIENIILEMRDTTLFVVSHQVSPRLLRAFDHHIRIGG